MPAAVVDIDKDGACQTVRFIGIDNNEARTGRLKARSYVSLIRSIAVNEKIVDPIRKIDDAHELGNVRTDNLNGVPSPSTTRRRW